MTALQRLIDGFADFRSGFWQENRALFDRLTREGQSPKVLLIGCSDARVDPAIPTRTQPGDLFTVRDVAAIVPPHQPDAAGYHGTSTALEFAVRGLAVEAFMVSLSNHEGSRTTAGARRFMVRQAHHEALLQRKKPDSIGHFPRTALRLAASEGTSLIVGNAKIG